MSLGLSEAQRRSVFAGLRVLAEHLEQMEAWLEKGGLRRGGVDWIDDVGPEEREALLVQLGEVHCFLETVFERLGHPSETISIFQRCQARPWGCAGRTAWI